MIGAASGLSVGLRNHVLHRSLTAPAQADLNAFPAGTGSLTGGLPDMCSSFKGVRRLIYTPCIQNLPCTPMRYVVLGLVLLLGSTGCASTYRLTPGVPDQAYKQLEALGSRYTASIRLRSGPTFKARVLHLSSDTLVTTRRAYALREIEWIRFRRRSAGLWRGILVGSLVGFVPPVLVLTGDCEGLGCLLVPVVAIAVGVYTVPLGAIGGGLIGYLHGYVDTFEVVNAPSPSSERPESIP